MREKLEGNIKFEDSEKAKSKSGGGRGELQEREGV